MRERMEEGADRRTAWAIAGYYFFSLAGLAIAAPYLPLYWRSLGFTGAALGALLTATGLGGFMAQGMGYISDRLGMRHTLVAGAMFLAAAVMLAYPLYRSLWVLLLATFVVNAAFRSADALVAAMVGDAVSGRHLTGVFSKIRMAGSFGWMFALLLSTQVVILTESAVIPRTFLAPMFLWISGCYVVAGVLALLTRVPSSGRRLRLGPLAALVAVGRKAGLARFLLAFGLFWTGMQGIGAFLSLFLQEMGASVPLISIAFATAAIVEVPFFLWAGQLGDRYGERRLLNMAFAVMPLRLLIVALAPSPAWVIVAQLLHGLTYGVMLVGAIAYVNARLPGALRASGQGALGSVMSVAATTAPFLGATLSQWIGWRGVYGLLVLVALLGWHILRGVPYAVPDPEPG
jgi:MFS transporter, PPP family, 3-phenylpropionic acid transporter